MRENPIICKFVDPLEHTPCCHPGCTTPPIWGICNFDQLFVDEKKTGFACDQHIPDAYNRAAALAIIAFAKRRAVVIANANALFEKFDAPLC